MNKDKILKIEDALALVKSLSVSDVVKSAYFNNGYVYLDLSLGALVGEEGLTTLKLYCMPNPNRIREVDFCDILASELTRENMLKNDLEARVRDFYVVRTFL